MIQKILHYKFTLITAGIIVFLSMAEGSELPSSPFFHIPHLDKMVHISMYTGLSLVLFLEKNWNSDRKIEKIWYANNFIPLLSAIFLGAIIELLQPILSDRGRDLYDFIANTIGAFLGFYFHKMILPWLKRQKIF